jgi:DNA-binding CsgD family transcriptional regulator
VLAAEGRWDEARRRLEDALDRYLEAQAPFEAAGAQLDLARCLHRAGRREAARQETGAALDRFRALGAGHEAERAEAVLRDLDGPAASPDPKAARPSSAAGPLTDREIEVLRLVAQGLGDKEIADRLNLSGHTVHRHISNIRTKLGLPSRAAAVAWAAQNRVL